MTLRPAMLAIAVAAALGACGDSTPTLRPSERITAAPVEFWVQAQGELKAAKATPLKVPGQNFARRQLVWMAPDGSAVKEGDVVARFSAAQAQLELDKALLDLQRNALARAGKESELGIGLDRVDVELAQAQSSLVIAQRYARADFEALARNTVLDAVQDEQFLGEKTGVLRWRQGQSAQRGAAELDVLGVQRNSIDANADNRRNDLAALELRAAHDGVFMLVAGWSGNRPQVGEQMWAGGDFANLPDVDSLEVELSLPQQEAQGLAIDQRVLLHPLGRPDQQVEGKLTWVASAPRQLSRQSPAKYVSAKASVPAEGAVRHGWVPGQAFSGRVILLSGEPALTVANVAVSDEGGEPHVMVLEDGEPVRRVVSLGVRGPARTQVLSGLAEGDRVLLGRDRSEAAGSEPADTEGTAGAGTAVGAKP